MDRRQAHIVVDTVSDARSSWQNTHIYAEAQRRVRAAGCATDASLAERITARALSAPLSRPHARVVDSDLGEPQILRRRDGASVYTTHGTDLFTSAAILSAEKRFLDAAGRTDGRRATTAAVTMALLEHNATRLSALNPGQEAVVREMACSGARVQLALAPAGSGKTTAMAALTRAWEESGGRVVGLSREPIKPSCWARTSTPTPTPSTNSCGCTATRTPPRIPPVPGSTPSTSPR